MEVVASIAGLAGIIIAVAVARATMQTAASVKEIHKMLERVLAFNSNGSQTAGDVNNPTVLKALVNQLNKK